MSFFRNLFAVKAAPAPEPAAQSEPAAKPAQPRCEQLAAKQSNTVFLARGEAKATLVFGENGDVAVTVNGAVQPSTNVASNTDAMKLVASWLSQGWRLTDANGAPVARANMSVPLRATIAHLAKSGVRPTKITTAAIEVGSIASIPGVQSAMLYALGCLRAQRDGDATDNRTWGYEPALDQALISAASGK